VKVRSGKRKTGSQDPFVVKENVVKEKMRGTQAGKRKGGHGFADWLLASLQIVI